MVCLFVLCSIVKDLSLYLELQYFPQVEKAIGPKSFSCPRNHPDKDLSSARPAKPVHLKVRQINFRVCTLSYRALKNLNLLLTVPTLSSCSSRNHSSCELCPLTRFTVLKHSLGTLNSRSALQEVSVSILHQAIWNLNVPKPISLLWDIQTRFWSCESRYR